MLHFEIVQLIGLKGSEFIKASPLLGIKIIVLTMMKCTKTFWYRWCGKPSFLSSMSHQPDERLPDQTFLIGASWTGL